MKIYPELWDERLLVFFNNLSPDVLNSFWKFITYTEHWIPLYLVLVSLFFYKTKLKISLVRILHLLIAVGVTHLLTELTKVLVKRQRPGQNETINDALKLLYEPNNFSFFSGHASTSFAASVFIYLLLKSKFKYPKLIFIWPLFFTLSRIFVGVHYPSDIIVGSCVGVMMGIIFYNLYQFSTQSLIDVSQ